MSGTEAEVPPCDSWEFDVLDVPPWDPWAVECPAAAPSAVQAPEAGAADELAQPQRAPHCGGRATPASSCSCSFRGAELPEHPRVVLLEYRRSPNSFRFVLQSGPELQEGRAPSRMSASATSSLAAARSSCDPSGSRSRWRPYELQG